MCNYALHQAMGGITYACLNLSPIILVKGLPLHSALVFMGVPRYSNSNQSPTLLKVSKRSQTFNCRCRRKKYNQMFVSPFLRGALNITQLFRYRLSRKTYQGKYMALVTVYVNYPTLHNIKKIVFLTLKKLYTGLYRRRSRDSLLFESFVLHVIYTNREYNCIVSTYAQNDF